MRLQVVDHPCPAAADHFLQGFYVAEAGLVIGKGIGVAAAVDEGLQQIGLGIVDRYRDAVDHGQLFDQRLVDGGQFLR